MLIRRLWPRALLTPFTDAVDLTEADRRAYAGYAQRPASQGLRDRAGHLHRLDEATSGPPRSPTTAPITRRSGPDATAARSTTPRRRVRAPCAVAVDVAVHLARPRRTPSAGRTPRRASPARRPRPCRDRGCDSSISARYFLPGRGGTVVVGEQEPAMIKAAACLPLPARAAGRRPSRCGPRRPASGSSGAGPRVANGHVSSLPDQVPRASRNADERVVHPDASRAAPQFGVVEAGDQLHRDPRDRDVVPGRAGDGDVRVRLDLPPVTAQVVKHRDPQRGQ